MTNNSVELMSSAGKSGAEAMTRSGNAAHQFLNNSSNSHVKRGRDADHIAEAGKANAETLIGGSATAIHGIQELTEAYQALATPNVENMMAGIKALSTVKTPVEFVEVQQNIMALSIDAAVLDWSNITKLTLSVLFGAIEPVKCSSSQQHNS